MVTRIGAFVGPQTQLGESPLYREFDNTLHYVDVIGKTINVLQLDDNLKRRTINCPEHITFLAFHKDGGYLICSFSSIVHVLNDGTWSVLKQVIPDTTKERLNDAGIDTHGRLWVGSIDRVTEAIPKLSGGAKVYEAKGSIYRYDPDGNLVVAQKGGVMAGNGLCWSPDNKTMYHVDSYINVSLLDIHFAYHQADSAQSIHAYDFDTIAGTISNRRLVQWDLNACRVTHGAWVGPDNRDLVVTTAQRDESSPAWEGEEGGALFYIRGCDSAGLPKYGFGVGSL
ncbi:SGL-domain-containing protein [Aspergillus steynii IBT 23096]|uniref:SGL-domain-containing protein n=1 Tax=Aspergillus steynii IBT 23096 TaxID=1392250 RepID=A0A2I2GHW6_9EURO|nr:SGL-domain-containing protein [Aspergillus steynii IBT 23096]PLB52475.1 SGL-domain-containing protein [Aspergillus steynii IBT 23096]